MDEKEIKKRAEVAKRRAELSKLEPISFIELESVFHKWLIIPDPGIIKFLMGFYCANKLSRKAVWAIIIAPSGGGKTEFLNALHDLEDVREVSLLTPNTFLSGMPGRSDASLLPQLTGKVMVFKDWTSLLSMQKEAKAEIFSQLREIWDGRMVKNFGNGRVASWEGKVSLLAASTQAVDQNQQMFTHLGERFINYRPKMPNKKEVAMRSLNNDPEQEKMNIEIRNATYAFVKGLNLDEQKTIPDLPQEIKVKLVDLANFAAMARSGIIRDFGIKKEVIFVPDTEMPTRIIQQLNTLGGGLAMVNGGKFDEKDMDILYKCALDSIPQTNKMVIQEMAKADGQTTAEIATALGYPTEPIRIYLENLAMLRVCHRMKNSGRADKWTLVEEFADIIRQYEGIEMLTDEEIKLREGNLEDNKAQEEFDGYESEVSG